MTEHKFRKLNLHGGMTECHEVCDDSAFMPTKEFPPTNRYFAKLNIYKDTQ